MKFATKHIQQHPPHLRHVATCDEGNVIWVLWQISYRYAFQQCKDFENRLRFNKVTERLKVGTFLRHSVI